MKWTVTVRFNVAVIVLNSLWHVFVCDRNVHISLGFFGRILLMNWSDNCL